MRALVNICLLFFSVQLLYSQGEKQFISEYLNYFQHPREVFHISTDKNSFKAGESIRFSVFILNSSTNKPFIETKNLLLGLFNEEGIQITRDVFLAEDGIANGIIRLDTDLKAGQYYLHATTNYAQNFNESSFEIKQIDVYQKNSPLNKDNNRPQISFAGEGGSIVSNLENVIAFRIEDELGINHAIQKGEIYNGDGDLVVGNIKSDKFGIGKFNLKIEENTQYTANFKLKNGLELTKKISGIKKDGLSLKLNNHSLEKVVMNVTFSEQYWKNFKEDDIHLIIHNDGKLLSHTISLKEKSTDIVFPRQDLFQGINILTILDREYKPLAERVFNNGDIPEFDNLISNIVERDQDSILLQLKIPKPYNSTAQLSISVTDSLNRTRQSIISSFKVLRHFKVDYQYKINLDGMSAYELDNYLIFKGSSNFSWTNIQNPPKTISQFDDGFSIKGKIKNRDLKNPSQILLYHNSIKNIKYTEINKDNTFEFNNIILKERDSLRFSIIDKEGNNVKPNLNISITPKLDELKLVFGDKNANKIEVENTSTQAELRYRDGKQLTALDPVQINAKIENEYQGDLPSTGIFEALKITDEDIKKHFKLSNLVRKLGFKVLTESRDNTFTILARISVRGAPIVIMNGLRVPPFDIYDYPLRNVDDISYEHSGVSGSPGGTIYINIGRFEEKKYLKDHLTTILADEGYKPTSVNENMQLKSTNEVIYWNGHAKLFTDNDFFIKIPDPKDKTIYLNVEGFTDDGKLISQQFTIPFDSGF